MGNDDQPIRLPSGPRRQRPEVRRNLWYATMSRLQENGELRHARFRRGSAQLGIADARDWRDLFTLRRVVFVVGMMMAFALLLEWVFG